MKTGIGLLLLALLTTGCSSAYYQSEGYAGDDLYGIHNKTKIAQREKAKAEAEKAEAEARRAKWEALMAQAQADDAENRYYGSNDFDDLVADDYESAYERRLRGFESPTYKMPSSYWNLRYSGTFNYLTAYDPAFYNIIVMGDEVWVEPKYITSMFGTWGLATGFAAGYMAGIYGSWYSSWGYGWPLLRLGVQPLLGLGRLVQSVVEPQLLVRRLLSVLGASALGTPALLSPASQLPAQQQRIDPAQLPQLRYAVAQRQLPQLRHVGGADRAAEATTATATTAAASTTTAAAAATTAAMSTAATGTRTTITATTNARTATAATAPTATIPGSSFNSGSRGGSRSGSYNSRGRFARRKRRRHLVGRQPRIPGALNVQPS